MTRRDRLILAFAVVDDEPGSTLQFQRVTAVYGRIRTFHQRRNTARIVAAVSRYLASAPLHDSVRNIFELLEARTGQPALAAAIVRRALQTRAEGHTTKGQTP